MKPHNRPEILNEIARVLRTETGFNKEIHEHTLLAQDLQLDSIKMLTLLLGVENHYQIYLSEDPDHPPTTIGELCDLIEKQTKNNHD